MSKSAFAQAIISKLKSSIGTSGKDYSAGSASAAMSAVAAGITEYLIANTTVMVSYVGVIPGVPPTPDPLVTDSFKIMGSCAPLAHLIALIVGLDRLRPISLPAFSWQQWAMEDWSFLKNLF